MVRLQVQLESAQHRLVRRRAKRLGVSVTEVIRRCVSAQLETDEPDEPEARRRRLLAVAGKYVDPGGAVRVAADHDAALPEAYRS